MFMALNDWWLYIFPENMSVAHMCAHSYSEAIKQSLVYCSLLFVSKEAKQHITVFQGFCLVFGSQ